MPYGYKRRFKKSTRRKAPRRKQQRRRKKKVLTVSKVARIARSVARLQVHQDQITLIKRQFWFGDYDSDMNIFTGGFSLSNAGVTVPLTNIRMLDTNMVVAAPVIPLAHEVNPQDPAVGNVIGMPTTTIHGYRTGNEVRISGFRIQLRVRQRKVPPADDPQTGVPDYLQNVGPFLLTRLKFYYKVFYLTQPFTGPDAQSGTYVPDIEKTLPSPKSWGFSPSLDIMEEQEIQHLKIRTLAKGSFGMTYSADKQRDRKLTISRKLKKCLKVQFDPRDQAGTNPHFGKIYLALRTDVPFDVNQVTLFSDYYPQIWACTKLFYHEG